jgi:hypothetical protein
MQPRPGGIKFPISATTPPRNQISYQYQSTRGFPGVALEEVGQCDHTILVMWVFFLCALRPSCLPHPVVSRLTARRQRHGTAFFTAVACRRREQPTFSGPRFHAGPRFMPLQKDEVVGEISDVLVVTVPGRA